jgi:hypothetical protein
MRLNGQGATRDYRKVIPLHMKLIVTMATLLVTIVTFA